MERAGDGGKKSQAPTFAGCVTKLQHKTIFSIVKKNDKLFGQPTISRED